MNKTVVIVYLIIFGLYILFTRKPDFFDSDITKATIHFAKDSAGETAPFAFYAVDSQTLKTDARYLFRSFSDGESCKVIYSTEQPQIGAVYSLWGYWLTWQEVIASIVLVIVLYQIAKAITRNPTPEGLLSELEDDKPRPKKRRYN
jgi:hypothetical protein